MPLLTNTGRYCHPNDDDSLQAAFHKSNNLSFDADEDDIQPINGARDFFREFAAESKKLWYLAGPAIFTSICQYSIGALTQVFAGQVGTIELAAVSVENSVVAGFAFGMMVLLLLVLLYPSLCHDFCIFLNYFRLVMSS